MDDASFKNLLLAKREELSSLLTQSADDSKPVELDQTVQGRLSRMDAMQQQQMALETKRRREAEIARIDAALQRIEQGEYGECVECGEIVAEKRLMHDPAATHCIDCA